MRQETLNLHGKWYIKHDPEDNLEKEGIIYDQSFSPVDWEEIEVPSHWQTRGFDYQGVVWYYKQFKIDNLERKTSAKAYLRFGGVDYLAQVWLNGVFLGVHEGDFDSFYFEVSNYLQEENRIFVKVSSEVDSRPEFKRVIKGGIYHWDCLPIKQEGLTDCPEVPSAANPQYPNPVINPGGIWKPVQLQFSTPFQLEEMQISPFFENQEKVYLKVEGLLHNWGEGATSLKGRIKLSPANFSGGDYNASLAIDIYPGANNLSYRVVLENPVLWWTWDLGKPNLYKFTFELIDDNGEVVLNYERLIGIRKVEKGKNWELYLNGKRFFARGTNYLSNQFLSLVTEDVYDQDIEMMLKANMNMVRVFSHMEKEYFYEQCDQKGLLIFQDLPFQWGYEPAPLLIEQARRLAGRFVKKLSNYASIFLWCCHSESRYHDYNKLDKVLETEVKRIDPGRPVWRNSVIMASGNPPEYFEGLEEFEKYVNSHLSVHWVGWYWGEIDDAEYYNPLFITEFGTQSVPQVESLRKFIAEKDLWPPNRDEWHYRGFQTNIYEKNIGDYPDKLEELVRITQEYQSRFYKAHIEALRRKKFNNVNGLLQFHFVNTWPAIDWSIIDYYRIPKKAYYTVQKAFNPLLLSFTGEFEENRVKISVWVVNDFHRDFDDLILGWKVLARGEVIFNEETRINKIYKNKAAVYIEKYIPVDSKRVVVQGTLYQRGDELASNKNILTPLKDFTNIETAP